MQSLKKLYVLLDKKQTKTLPAKINKLHKTKWYLRGQLMYKHYDSIEDLEEKTLYHTLAKELCKTIPNKEL